MFNVGDIVEVFDDSKYSYTKNGSYGTVVELRGSSCRVNFEAIHNTRGMDRRLTEEYRLNTFTIQNVHLRFKTPSDPSITPVIRKIRQMEKHFLSRKEASNA